jgi:hypothetical protein
MSNIKRYTSDEIEGMESQSNKKKFDETTEKDILEQSMSDTDTPVLTEEELREMELVKSKKERKNEKQKD